MHLSPRTQLTIRFSSNTHSTKLRLDHTYPPSPAFLYYHLPPGLPETAGEVRIRLTSGSDPKCFDDGMDLIKHGSIWRLPLIVLAGDDRYTDICTQLLSDGLVTPELLSICNHLWTQLNPSRIDSRLNFLHSLSQEFFIYLTAIVFTVTPVGRGTAGHPCHITNFLYKNPVKLFAQGTHFLSLWSTDAS
jgi:hypothetical protein